MVLQPSNSEARASSSYVRSKSSTALSPSGVVTTLNLLRARSWIGRAAAARGRTSARRDITARRYLVRRQADVLDRRDQEHGVKRPVGRQEILEAGSSSSRAPAVSRATHAAPRRFTRYPSEAADNGNVLLGAADIQDRGAGREPADKSHHREWHLDDPLVDVAQPGLACAELDRDRGVEPEVGLRGRTAVTPGVVQHRAARSPSSCSSGCLIASARAIAGASR